MVLVLLVGCEKSRPSHNLDLDLIRVSADARLRTDTVGDGRFTDLATFVLVDAENTGREGAYVTLGGELAADGGVVVGTLRAQSLWIPPGEQRTFALIDTERKPRPTATAAKIRVFGALVPQTAPRVHVDNIREIPDDGKIVVQGILANDAEREGHVLVIGSFHGEDGRPMTRPFSMITVPAHGTQGVQFVGPVGSKHGTIYFGDATF